MRLLFWIAFRLRLKQKFWGDWFMRWHRKEIEKMISKIDLDTSQIRILEEPSK